MPLSAYNGWRQYTLRGFAPVFPRRYIKEKYVKTITVGGEPLDPAKTYTVASTDYVLKAHGDGLTAFDGAAMLQENVKIDYQVLTDYITETLGGEIGAEYADPYGSGRITIEQG